MRIVPELNERTDELIGRALAEDLGTGDITTDAIVSPDIRSTACLYSKAKGILAGIEIFARVFYHTDPDLEVKIYCRDGEEIGKNDIVAAITGSAASILKAERTALNFLGRMSGIATRTRQFVDLAGEYGVKILDTRKTAPGMRHLDKYAVRMGGGENHRFGLYDMVLIKDNHIAIAGGICGAVEKAMARLGESNEQIRIEVECKSCDEVMEAIRIPVDIIMLDNMEIGEIRRSVEAARKAALETGKKIYLEASGNITLGNVRDVAETGVDFISIGALTHSVICHDFSLLFGNCGPS